MKSEKAKDFLLQVEKLDRLIENKLIERQQWQSIAMGVTSGGESVLVKVNGKTELQNMEKVQSSGNPQKMSDAIIKYIEIDAEIDRCIEFYVDTRKDVIEVIEKLPAQEYDLLHKVYIQHITLAEAADAYNTTYSNVTTVHGRALKMLQNILNERNKDGC